MRNLALAILLIASAASAQTITGIQGQVDEGVAVTIIGTSFGTKTTAAPDIFDDFNDGLNETEIDSLYGISHNWLSGGVGSTDPARYSNEVLRDGAGMNMRFIYPDRITGTSLEDAMQNYGVDYNIGDRVYVTFWAYSTFQGAGLYEGGTAPQQWKSWRLSHGDNGYPACVMLWNGAGGAPGTMALYSYNGNGAEDMDGFRNQDNPIPARTWWHMEVELEINSAVGVADGTEKMWYNGQFVSEETDWLWADSIDDPDDIWNSMMLGQYIQNIPTDTVYTVRYDDVYIDGTWSRVMLGNRSTFDSCTHREIQIPSAWSATSITVDVNLGTFTADSSSVYLFVVNADGNASSGYPVTIGGGGLPTPDIQSATRSGGNAELTWLSGDGGPYMVWLQASGQDVRALATTDTTATLPMSSAATDVTVKDGTSQRRAHIAE